MTRPVGHSSTSTSDLYRRRVRLSRLSPSAGPGRTGPHLAVRPGRAAPGRAGPGRAGPGRAGQLPAPGRASERHRRQGFGAHDRAGLRHATGGRASERDQASAHTTGPGFGTPLAQLIPRRRIGLCRRFPRFIQLSPCLGRQMPCSSSNDLILVVPYYSRRLPTGRHGTSRNFVETGLNINSRFPN